MIGRQVLSEMNESADFRRSLEESGKFVAEMRAKSDAQDSEQQTQFWTGLRKLGSHSAEVLNGYRNTAKKLSGRLIMKFILMLLFVNAVLFGVLYIVFFHNEMRYHKAETLLEAGEYSAAQEIFGELSAKDYKDTHARVAECQEKIDGETYAAAVKSFESGDYAAALGVFQEISGFQDSAKYIPQCREKIVESYGARYCWDFSGSMNEKNGLQQEITGTLQTVPLGSRLPSQAAVFAGGENYILAPGSLDLSGEWSVSMLVRADDLHAERNALFTYYARGGGYSQKMTVSVYEGSPGCRVIDGRGNDIIAKSTRSLALHQWALVTAVKSGGFLDLYVDGTLQMRTMDGGNYAPDEGAEGEPVCTVLIGCDPETGAETGFVGDIGWIGVYGSALTEEQIGMIAETYNAPQDDGTQTADIPSNAFSWGGHHYAVFSNCVNLDEAAAYCALRGGYLASVNTEEENLILRSATALPVVIGLRTEDGGEHWSQFSSETQVYNGFAEDCDPPEPGLQLYARFSRSQDNPGWYLYRDRSGETDDAGNPIAQDPFSFLCEWDS